MARRQLKGPGLERINCKHKKIGSSVQHSVPALDAFVHRLCSHLTNPQRSTTWRSSAIFAGALISEVKAAGVPASATFEAVIELQLARHEHFQRWCMQADACCTMRWFSPCTPGLKPCICLRADYKVGDDGAKGRASKCVQLYRLPRVLVLHLERFTHDVSTGGGKLHKPVRFDAVLKCGPCAWEDISQCLP